MRQGSADDLDRADEIGVDLMPDLIVAHLFRSAKEAVGRVVHNNIDATHSRERAINYPAHRLRIGHVQ